MSAAAILLVEDNRGDVMLIQEALENAGVHYHLELFEDAEQAGRALTRRRAEPPDLILLDLNTPRGDGFELLSIARANPSIADAPVAVISSSVSPSDRERALQLGANCYIQKPSSLDEFLTVVGGAVRALLQTHPVRLGGD